MRFSAAPSQARSCASVAVAASTSDAAPVACAARSRSRVGDGSGRRGEPGRLSGTVGLVHLGCRLSRRRAPAAGPAGSPAVLDAGDDGDAVQDRAGRQVGGLGVLRK